MELFWLIIPVAVTAQNRVLQLNGGDDCVKLPSDIFNEFDEATVEVWVKWQSFRHYSQVFNFGAKERMAVDHSLPNLKFYIARRKHGHPIELKGILRLNQLKMGKMMPDRFTQTRAAISSFFTFHSVMSG